jgi:AraC family transcriptional regulator of adaptative response/methylated-DNA-[protein]-cysteine methyltransferase
MTQPTTDDRRWVQVQRREKHPHPPFFLAVRTTGVYCRPSCGGRMPKRENVVFYATRPAARAAGYRACKRCRPDEPRR